VDDRDKLKRASAGDYVTADGRFTVRSDGGRWFLVDAEQTDELGLELVRGPYPSRRDAEAAIGDARRQKVVPIAKTRPKPAVGKPGARASARPAARPRPKHETWLDRLPSAESAHIRALIRALEREGISDAERLVQRDREGLAPAVVQRLIEIELAALVAESPPQRRGAAAKLVRRAAAIVAGQGTRGRGLPGWRVVEVGPQPEPPNRRVTFPD